jgi:hypothetical protein
MEHHPHTQTREQDQDCRQTNEDIGLLMDVPRGIVKERGKHGGVNSSSNKIDKSKTQ